MYSWINNALYEYAVYALYVCMWKCVRHILCYKQYPLLPPHPPPIFLSSPSVSAPKWFNVVVRPQRVPSFWAISAISDWIMSEGLGNCVVCVTGVNLSMFDLIFAQLKISSETQLLHTLWRVQCCTKHIISCWSLTYYFKCMSHQTTYACWLQQCYRAYRRFV